MRLKYQLRGLGIGIILTAAFLMIFSDETDVSAKTDNLTVVESTVDETTEENKETESIVEETIAEEESVVETETHSEAEQTETESVSEEVQIEVETTSEELPVVEEESISETTEEVSAEDEIIEEEQTVKNNSAVVKIKIVSGDDSGTVSRKLQTAGLVENASEFDAYLMQHGYDKKISVGEVEIEKGTSWLEIAEKISGR